MSEKTAGQAAYEAHPFAGEVEWDDLDADERGMWADIAKAAIVAAAPAEVSAALGAEVARAIVARDETRARVNELESALTGALGERDHWQAEAERLNAQLDAALQGASDPQRTASMLEAARQSRDDLREQLAAVIAERNRLAEQADRFSRQLAAAVKALSQINGYAVGAGLEAGALADVRAIATRALQGVGADQTCPGGC